jgi:hypothetical protein
VFQNLLLDHEGTAELISASGRLRLCQFHRLGRRRQAIERAAAGTFTGSTELGGKDPGYVMDDADLDWAVDTLMDGAMFNSGQCCCGIERIYVAPAPL